MQVSSFPEISSGEIWHCCAEDEYKLTPGIEEEPPERSLVEKAMLTPITHWLLQYCGIAGDYLQLVDSAPENEILVLGILHRRLDYM